MILVPPPVAAKVQVLGASGDLAKRSGLAQRLARVIEPHGIGDVERLRPKLHARRPSPIENSLETASSHSQ